MYNPLVSIIIPVYNGSNFLRESIESALKQTYKNIEIIVVNDGSNDNGVTESIALSYGEKVRYFSQINGGVSSALNHGISKMNGSWFSWLSHDDLYLENKIEVQVEKLNSKNVVAENTIICSDIQLIDEKGKNIYYPKKVQSGLFNGKEVFKKLANGTNIYGCALLIPKKVMDRVGGFNKDFKFIQDWMYWLELAKSGSNFLIHDEQLVKSRVHGNQQTKKIADLQPKEIKRFLTDFQNRNTDYNVDEPYYIKTLLFYYCTKKNINPIRKKYMEKLRKSNNFSFLDKLIYIFFLIKGQLILLVKTIYKTLQNMIYRS